MCSKNLTQCLVEQVCAGVVCRTGIALFNVHLCCECCSSVGRQLLGYVYWKVVLFLCVNNLYALVSTNQKSGVANLTAALGIERCLFENYLVKNLVLLLCHTVTQNGGLVLGCVVTNKCALAFVYCCPVAVFNNSRVACPCLLFEHLLVELLHIYAKPVLAKNQLCKVNGEPECIVQRKCFNAANLVLAFALGCGYNLVEHTHTGVESAQE